MSTWHGPWRPRTALLLLALALAGSAWSCDEQASQRVGDQGLAPGDGTEVRSDGGAGTNDAQPPILAECQPGLALAVEVKDDANAASHGAAVSGGVPLARGALAEEDLSQLGLIDAKGQLVRSFQTPSVLGRWSDGSVKWLLLDFLADLPAGGSARYTLCALSTQAAPLPAITVSESDSAYTVDTGKLRAVLSKTRFSLLEEAWIDGNGDGDYSESERLVNGPGELFIDLDDSPPGLQDSGATDYPASWSFGMEGGNWLRDSQSQSATRYLASAGDYQLSQYRAGSTHTIFKLEGMHKNAASGRSFGAYTLYLHFYAGQSQLKVSHTWVMTGDPKKNFIRRMALELPFAAASETLTYSCGGAFETEGTPVTHNAGEPPLVPLVQGPSEVLSGSVAAAGQLALVAIGPDKYYHNVPLERDLKVGYQLLVDGQEVQQGHSAAGWLDVSAGGLGIAAGVRDFWREHPKELQVSAGRLQVYLWPDHGGKTLDLRRRYDEIRGPASSAGQAARREFAPAGSAVGLAKTTDLFFYLHPGDAASAAVDDQFRRFQAPLLPVVTGQQVADSGVFGNLAPYDAQKHPRSENFIDLTFAWLLRAADEFSWYGMLDYGDHLLEYESINWELNVPANWGLYANWGYSGWMQEAYRLGPGMILQYLRSGRTAYFRAADSWLRHHRDVDGVFWDTPDDGTRPGDNKGGPRLGAGHRHDQQHWGGYLAGYGQPIIATAMHYFLTGEGRDLDALRLFSAWVLDDARIESQGKLAVLYAAEALGDEALAQRAYAKDVKPALDFGRTLYDSGLGLLLYDIHTGGAPDVRARLRSWAEPSDEAFAFIRSYLEAQEGQGSYLTQLAADADAIFPDGKVRAQFFSWAPRQPTSFRDAFTPEIMGAGPFAWPFQSIEHLIFDGPFGLGNNPSRQMLAAQLMFVLSELPADP